MKKRVGDLEKGTIFLYRNNLHVKTLPMTEHEWESVCVIASDREIDWAGGPTRWNDDVIVDVIYEEKDEDSNWRDILEEIINNAKKIGNEE